jgi:hypothetical protein
LPSLPPGSTPFNRSNPPIRARLPRIALPVNANLGCRSDATLSYTRDIICFNGFGF